LLLYWKKREGRGGKGIGGKNLSASLEVLNYKIPYYFNDCHCFVSGSLVISIPLSYSIVTTSTYKEQKID